MGPPDWYAVLGVGRAASDAQISRAFRRLAFRWHPDRNLNQPELAHRQFLLVHQAYEALTDPVRRRAFDAAHGAPKEQAAAPAAGTPTDAGGPRAAPAPRSVVPPIVPAARPSLARRMLSGAAWVLLGFAIKLLGFVALFFFGSLAEKLAREDLQRKAPVFTSFVFPIGRTLLVGGIALLIVQRLWIPLTSPRFAIILIVIGVVMFAIERLALASVWAFGRGRRPKA